MKRLTAAASAGITTKRRGRSSMPRSAAGRGGSLPIASTIVSANLAGSAVSSTIIGTPGSACSRATFRPSAVCGVDHRRRSAACMSADRRQAVGVRAAARRRSRSRRRASTRPRVSVNAPSLLDAVVEQLRACAPRSRPSRSKTKRSKFDAFEMSIDGLEVSCVSAPLRTR